MPISDKELAALQVASYQYPDAATGKITPFAWDWRAALQAAAAPISAGLKISNGNQVIIMPGTGGGLSFAETLRQWSLNLIPLPDKENNPILGWVCRRFYDEVDDFVNQLLVRLSPHQGIYVIGHSRGAAQATYVAGLLKAKNFNIAKLVCFAPPRSGGQQLKSHLADIPKALYRNTGPDGHDYVTDVPLDIPLIEPCIHIADLTDIHAEPKPLDLWGPFRFHHMQLYAQGIADLEPQP